jgi:hypothetical protein
MTLQVKPMVDEFSESLCQSTYTPASHAELRGKLDWAIRKRT